MLDSLYAGAIEDAAARAELISISQLEKLALAQPDPIDAIAALAPAKNVKILAEVKRASPSKGNLAEIPNPAELASIYAENGASAISVLTEQRRFKGSLTDFDSVRSAVSVPLLRKDFLANEYQILEARAHGADIVLLIVAGIEPAVLIRLKKFAESLGMVAFVETHSADELRFAADTGAKLIGVNARDLATFETDRDLFVKLIDLFPSQAIKVAESAVRSASDVKHYRDAGADVVLVGEALVTNDPAVMLKQFLEF
jgi:indole-3-glycerol phosphate synthase